MEVYGATARRLPHLGLWGSPRPMPPPSADGCDILDVANSRVFVVFYPRTPARLYAYVQILPTEQVQFNSAGQPGHRLRRQHSPGSGGLDQDGELRPRKRPQSAARRRRAVGAQTRVVGPLPHIAQAALVA